jgi:hypothetical protein
LRCGICACAVDGSGIGNNARAAPQTARYTGLSEDYWDRALRIDEGQFTGTERQQGKTIGRGLAFRRRSVNLSARGVYDPMTSTSG